MYFLQLLRSASVPAREPGRERRCGAGGAGLSKRLSPIWECYSQVWEYYPPVWECYPQFWEHYHGFGKVKPGFGNITLRFGNGTLKVTPMYGEVSVGLGAHVGSDSSHCLWGVQHTPMAS